ncbi:MAG: type II toxin-antitoxin system prevent-host-death family antitoxin [Proteobacteria bacterium]|nr:type II toxin-antitoxin system prevent-host-death family antitoxin [Pseudomonadota bacterium]MBS0464448.1 type II toxin-antitoxin system prevent-host-death family antitoxin [Pseudomonadota bacterium]
MRVNILEAKNNLSRLIKSAQAGEDVVIANRGEPVVRLVPVAVDKRKRGKGNGRAILEWLKAHPLPDYARRSEKEIEADIQEARNSWD